MSQFITPLPVQPLNTKAMLKAATVVLWGLVAVVSLNAGNHAISADNRKLPNVVVILIDDMGYTDLGCYGSKFFETPNIDRLAREGMRFTDGYAACPVCSPTRASIIAGKFPARLNLTDWLPGRADRPSQMLLRPKIQQALPLEEFTLAEALAAVGYKCGAVGKWHLGERGFLPEDQGFHRNVGGTEKGSPPGGYFKFKTPSLELDEGQYLTDELHKAADLFIKQHVDEPFFLYLSHYAVHIPLQAKAELTEHYRQKLLSAEQTRPTHTNPIYAAMIHSVDQGVGRLLDTLDRLKLSDNTIIFFTSDNGGLSVPEGPNTPATSNSPLKTGKGYLYEGGIREPFIVRFPGTVPAGTTCQTPVVSMDIYPTVMELAGVQTHQQLDGVSLVPLLKQTGTPERQALYWHYPHYSNQGGKPGGAVRMGDYKLIEFYEDNHLELYNLRTDVGENQNLADAQPDRTRSLHAQLATWRNAVKAQMMTPNPNYQPNTKP